MIDYMKVSWDGNTKEIVSEEGSVCRRLPYRASRRLSTIYGTLTSFVTHVLAT